MNTMTREERIEAYHARRAERVERLRDRATAKRHEADRILETARHRADMIPFGQPILVGHYSEGRDRNFRSKISRGYDKGFSTQKDAQRLEDRADNMEGNTAIMADNPEADTLLNSKVASLERLQAHYKAINAAIRKEAKNGTEAQIAAVVAAGCTPEDAARYVIPPAHMACYGQGIQSFTLANLSARIRDAKKRAEKITKVQALPVQETEGTNARIEDNPPENRIRLFFTGKPEREVIDQLKRGGFRWTPSLGCWQAYRNYNAMETGKRLAGLKATAK